MITKYLHLITIFFLMSGCNKKDYYIQEKINNGYNYNQSLFQQDIFEEKESVLLEIEIGSIPIWLSGRLVQNGPGKFKVGSDQLKHWFDGFALLRSINFVDGKAYFSSAFLKTDQYLNSMDQQKIRLVGFADNYGEDEKVKISHDGQKIGTSNANINIEEINNHFFALGETPLPVEFDPITLKTQSILDYDDKLKKSFSLESSHMKRDYNDNSLYNFYIDYGLMSNYVIYKITNNSFKREVIAKQKIAYPSYMHDFSITENYIILTAYPLIINPLNLLSSKKTFIGSHKWQPNLGTIIYIFDKKLKKLVNKIKTKSIFAFHHINAYEDSLHNINLYMSVVDSPNIITELGDITNKYNEISLTHFKINPKNSEINISKLSNESYELPTIAKHLTGKKNKYFYAVWFSTPSRQNSYGLAKYNLETNKSIHWFEENIFIGEPLFIPSPTALQEDDGVIITIGYDIHKRSSYLFIFNALNLNLLVKARLPQALPQGLHGKFIK